MIVNRCFFGTIVIFLLFFFIGAVFSNVPRPTDHETRSTKVEGTLLCGSKPLKNAVVRLYRGKSDSVDDSIGESVTDDFGKFKISGNTARFASDKSDLDPHLKIYHKCDDADGKSGYRYVTFRYPRAFVNSGSLAYQTYNVGSLNLELEYPGEKRESNIVGYTGPKPQ